MWDKPFMSTFEELDCEYMHYYLVFEQRNMARPRVQCSSSRGSLALDVTCYIKFINPKVPLWLIDLAIRSAKAIRADQSVSEKTP